MEGLAYSLDEMGSCSSEQHNEKGLDTAVGGLVWVRRGNGSWWPGQIMNVEEVSDACLDVPVPKFNGVPIKLLGRDDVTVEWYNLELTTKVKSFRCGEHDSCIEKAKASLANPSKKRLKHARRENAIILALELETSLISKNCDMCSGANNFDSEPHGSCSKVSPAESHPTVVIGLNSSSFKEKSDSAPELSHSGISFEEARDGHLDKVKRQRTPNDSEDDGNEGIKKRMRGLDDLGLGSNTKDLTGLVTESAPQGIASVSDVSASNSLPTKHHANGNRGGCISFFKKKRSKVLFHDILKRKNRRRMLTKVLQSDTLVSVPIIFDELPSPRKSSSYDGKLSGFVSNDNDNNSNSTEVSCENVPLKYASEHAQDADVTYSKLMDCDMSTMSELLGYGSLKNLFDVPLICEAELSYGSPLLVNPPLEPQNDSVGDHLCGNSPVEVNAETNEAHEEHVSNTTSMTTHLNNLTQKIERGPSEWQLKGRRNSRHQNRNPEPEEPKPVDLADPENQPGRFSPSQQKPFSYRQSRFSLLPRYDIPYLDSVLYDVHIEVKASYRPQHQHVPYISLMSKLNGKPITGHPITVEVLEDGECDLFVDVVAGVDEDGDELMEPRKSLLSKKQLVLQPYFSPSKPPAKNKKQGSSSKKTRRLSTLTRSHGKIASNYKERKLVVGSLKAPALACIPLKVVFSRINEALNGSTRARGS